jgi:hypothetical protein
MAKPLVGAQSDNGSLGQSRGVGAEIEATVALCAGDFVACDQRINCQGGETAQIDAPDLKVGDAVVVEVERVDEIEVGADGSVDDLGLGVGGASGGTCSGNKQPFG